MAPEKIIIDTDPGQDDAIAILMALGSPDEIEILGISTLAGNVPLEVTSRNALAVLELGGRPDIPVYAGSARPMQRAPFGGEKLHGSTGLDGVVLPEPQIQLQDQHGVHFIIETLRREPAGSVTICTLGPLTNLATAYEEAPDIIPRIKRHVMMGGAYFEVGNSTPTGEFNVYVDPEAAKIVFGAGVDLTVIPLDATLKALCTPDRHDAIEAVGTPVALAAAAWVGFYGRRNADKYGSSGGPLHDPCVIAYVIKPALFSGRYLNVEIETDSELTRGMTVADWWGVTERAPNALFIGDIDADGFYKLLTERLARL